MSIQIPVSDLVLLDELQARDIDLIDSEALAQAQRVKQEDTIKSIKRDLKSGLSIRIPITVYDVDGRMLVVDGFHRTKASKQHAKSEGLNDYAIPAHVVTGKTYADAYHAAQLVNRDHGVGVTKTEQIQSGFRSLICSGQKPKNKTIMEICGVSKGYASELSVAIKLCQESTNYRGLNDGLTVKQIADNVSDAAFHYLPTSGGYDRHGFPNYRLLLRGLSNKPFFSDDEISEKERMVKAVAGDLERILNRYGSDAFREGLRKATRGKGLGLNIQKRTLWLPLAEQDETLAASILPDESVAREEDF